MAKPNKTKTDQKSKSTYDKWDDDDNWPKHDIPRDPVAEKKSAKSARRVVLATATLMGVMGAGCIAIGIMYSPIALIGLAGIGGLLPSLLSAVSDLKRESEGDNDNKPKAKKTKPAPAQKMAKPGMLKSLFMRLSGKKAKNTPKPENKVQPKPPQK